MTPGHEVSAIDGDTLLFMHLPKTGGTSLRSAVLQAYSDREVGMVYGAGELEGAMSREQFQALPAEELARFDLIVGHFPFGVHRRVPRSSRYVTVVRDPVDRVVSLYFHYRNLPGIRFGGKGHRERLRMRLRRTSLEDWVFEDRRLGVDNLMVRNIAGARGVPFGACTEAMFDEAMANIETHFAALLVTEEMDRSADLLERIIGLPLPTIPRDNANPNRPPLKEMDRRALERIHELNRFDARVHEHARGWLDAATGSPQRGEAPST